MAILFDYYAIYDQDFGHVELVVEDVFGVITIEETWIYGYSILKPIDDGIIVDP